MRLHIQVLFLGLSLLLPATLTGCSNASAKTSAPPAPKVTVMQPVKRDLADTEEFNGWMAADQIVQVRSRSRGHIAKVHFTDGQFVDKGQLLFELDARPFQNEIDKIKDDLKVYEAQHVAATKDEARLKDLQTKGGASMQQVEKAEADSQSLDAQISATKNKIKRAELELDYSKITADIAGRIGKAELTEGNLVNAGGSDPLLTTIVSIDPILIYFNVDERSLQRYGQNVEGEQGAANVLANLKKHTLTFTFALDGETEFSHTGAVSFGDNRVDPTTGTLMAYGTVENKGGKYLPGSRVRVRLPVAKPYSALLVPETCILADQDKRYVLIADGEKNVKRRDVALGKLTDDGMRAIQPAGKLESSEKPEDWTVLIDNLQRARLNYPIDPQKSEQPAATEKPAS
jgi:multidrug efflux system membrane fusion protein